MTELEKIKTCLSCAKTLRGRSDKKFCDDYCRNNYNNQLKAKENNGLFVRQTNNALLKNRKILASILRDEETARSHKEKLIGLGFLFKYITHLYHTKSGKTYFYCYEYGYLPLDFDWYLIVRKKDD